MDSSDIAKRIASYFGKVSAEPNHRYRSWEHCYRFFRARPRNEIRSDLDVAALQLGFYLASWGMYRGSSFLLQRDYTVHKRAKLSFPSASLRYARVRLGPVPTTKDMPNSSYKQPTP